MGWQETTELPPSVALRRKIRAGWSGLTSGLAPGVLQGNLMILPEKDAMEFVAFCEINAGPCPILGVFDAGCPAMPALAKDLDIRRDVGRYRVLRDGVAVEERDDIVELWRDDFVAIVLGCWFSSEARLAAAGIRMRHIELGVQGALFRTNVNCRRAGKFATRMVVSMRPFAVEQIDRVIEITSRMPLAHGAPIHVGDPGVLGIDSLENPDFGERIMPLPGEKALFWACGVTASLAVEAARPSIAITHVPGHMVITDLPA